MSTKVYRVLEKESVVAIFKTKKYANDFIEYQATLGNEGFEIEVVSLTDWLLQPREF